MLERKKIANILTRGGAHLARPGRAKLLAGWSCVVFWRTAVRLDARPCLPPFARFALFLMPWASSNLFSSPQSSQNAIFASKIRKFSLKAQKSRNISKIAQKEANVSLSRLD